MNKTTQPIEWKYALKLMDNISDYRDRLFFTIGFYTGLRSKDIRNLKWSDLMASNGRVLGEVSILEEKTKKARKNAKMRKIYLNKDFRKRIREAWIMMPNKAGYIFVGRRGPGRGKPITANGANIIIKRCLKEHRVIAVNHSTHLLRKTFGRRAWIVGGKSFESILILQKIFNHATWRTTMRYIGADVEVVKGIYLDL